MTVLIITNEDDVHADLVVPLLEGIEYRTRVVRLNTETFASNCSFELSGEHFDGVLMVCDSDRQLELSEIHSVWYRKPNPVQPPPLEFAPARSFIASESEAFLRSFYDLLADRFWMSCPSSVRRASQKLPNLRVARQLGLVTPDTLVCNRPAAAEVFARRHRWNVLVKPFALETFKAAPDGCAWDTFAARFDEATFQMHRGTLRLAPAIIQEYVEKDVELRATIVGEQVFCTAICSQAHPQAREDWRAVDVEELEHRPFDLPMEIREKLLAFNRHFGLAFCAVDLILDRQGRYVWLEANANGQWRWLEDLTGQPISRAIAKALARAH